MNFTVTLGEFLTIGGLLITAGTLVQTVRATKSELAAVKESTSKEISALKISLSEAHRRLDEHMHESGEYRERVARDYVTTVALRDMETRLEKKIDTVISLMERWLSKLGASA